MTKDHVYQILHVNYLDDEQQKKKEMTVIMYL